MVRLLYLLALLGLLVGYYEAFGPGPGRSELVENLEWWRPWGFSDRWEGLEALADGGLPGLLVPLALFALPPLALLTAGTLLFRSVLMRVVVWTAALAMGVFVWYGYQSPGVWRFFGWRFPSVALSVAMIAAAMLFAPGLLRRVVRASLLVTVLALAAVFVGVFLLSTEITGTNPLLRFNISPWPVVSLFGLLLVGSWLAAVHGAAGLGSWIAARLGGAGGLALGTLAAAAVGGALCFVIFDSPGPLAAGAIVSTSALYSMVCHLRAPADLDGAPRDALLRLGAGAFLFIAIAVSNQLAVGYQQVARNETATRVLVALETFKQENAIYPDRLGELVPDYLASVPRPAMGLLPNDEFTYSNFGDSYALEFASVQWVQCGYSPPFEYASYEEDEELYEEEDEDREPWEAEADVAAAPPPEVDPLLAATLAEHGLDGAWNCATTPPKLW